VKLNIQCTRKKKHSYTIYESMLVFALNILNLGGNIKLLAEHIHISNEVICNEKLNDFESLVHHYLTLTVKKDLIYFHYMVQKTHTFRH